MALPSTHSSVNGLSERLTSLDTGLHHEVYTLEKEDRCHTPHWLTLQCHRNVHVHWLRKLLSYMLPSCAHILKPLTDQSGLITYFMDRQNAKSICTMRFAYDCKSIACLDHNKWFGIHTYASDFQLGTYYSRRKASCLPLLQLTMSQQNYTALEKDTIISTLKEFWDMLLEGHSHFYRR